MATWTRLAASAASDVMNICSDGVNIFYVDGDPEINITTGDVLKFDTSTDTESTVVDTSALPGTSVWISSIAVFKGDLYVQILSEDTPALFSLKVYKLVGSSLSLVYTFYSGRGPGEGAHYSRLYVSASEEQLIATSIITGFPDFGFTSQVVYSGDGTRWSVGSWAVDPLVPASWSHKFNTATSFSNGVYDYFCNSEDGTPAHLCDNEVIYLWDGVSSFVVHQPTPHTEGMHSTSPNGNIHWAITGDEYFDLPYLIKTTLTVNTTVLHQVNMRTMFATKKLGVGLGSELYFLSANSLTWNLLDTINFLAFDPNFEIESAAIIKMTNNDVYIVGVNNFSTFVEIWKRSEQLLFTLSGFFQDRDKVTFRSEMPVPSIAPGAIHSVGKRTYVGTGEPSSPVVAYAESEDSFGSWTDFSGSLSTAAAIKAFSGTPWGDSEDLESSEDPNGFQGGPSGKCS